MTVLAWGAVGWINVAVASRVVMLASGAFNGLNLVPLEQDLTSEGARSRPAVWANPQFLTARLRPLPAGILLGVLALMKFKSDLVGSVLVSGIAVLHGLLSARPCCRVGRRRHFRERAP